MPGWTAGDIPGFIAPMLATAAARLPPDAAEFVAEVKWDGLRACIAVEGGRVRAWSRTGRPGAWLLAAVPVTLVISTYCGLAAITSPAARTC
jgi:ATP dependent DNA ligase domain